MTGMTVADLQARYGVGRSAIYRWLKKLNVPRQQIGRRAYIEPDQIARIDQLWQHLRAGGSLDEFVVGDQAAAPSTTLTSATSAPSLRANSLCQVEYFNYLESAFMKGWLLSTAEVSCLLGIPEADIDSLECFADAGFQFVQTGHRQDGQKAWRVLKDWMSSSA